MKVRTSVIFSHPANFVPVSTDEGILSVEGADWFISLLKQIPELEIDPNLCQEDWGVVVFAQRRGKQFWVGLSAWADEHTWVAYFHHKSFAMLQRWSTVGRRELDKLILDAHDVLIREPSISSIEWFYERDLGMPSAHGSAKPGDEHDNHH